MQSFVVTDPRTFEGDPFEVAERAAIQAEAVARILSVCLEGAALMARNAQAERDILMSGDCDMASYADTAEGRRFEAIRDRVAAVQRDLRILIRAVGFNPKQPLTAGA